MSKCLDKVDEREAAGPDDIPNLALKRLSKCLALPLSIILHQSYSRGKLPAEWLLANVSPIHKKGSTSDVNNYRPISLTVNCCKIMEQIITSHLLKFLSVNDLMINPSQFGFTAGKSCTTQLIMYLDYVTRLENRVPLS